MSFFCLYTRLSVERESKQSPFRLAVAAIVFSLLLPCMRLSRILFRVPARPRARWFSLHSSFAAPIVLLTFLSLAVQFSLAPTIAFALPRAEEVGAKVQAARNGEISLDEFAEYVIRVALESPQVLEYIIGMKFTLPGFREALGISAVKRMRASVAKGSVAEAESLNELARAFLDEKNAQREQIQDLYFLVKKVDLMVGEKDLDGLLELYLGPKDIGVEELIEQRIGDAIVKTTEAQIADQDPLIAIRTLAGVDAKLHNNELESVARKIIHDTAPRLLDGSYVPQTWTLQEPAVQAMVQKLLPLEREAFVAFYQWRTIFLITQDNIEEGSRYYNLVIGNRPDPNDANTMFRKELVFAAEGPKSKEFAIGRLAELQNTDVLSTRDKCRLLLRGFYGVGFLSFFLGAMCIILFCLLFLVIRPRSLMSGIEEIRDLFHERKRQNSGDTAGDEYSQLLAILGLNDNASEAQIKRAFRDAVKRYHPDMAGAMGIVHDQDGNVDEAFKELRRVYERILEIRSTWFAKGR